MTRPEMYSISRCRNPTYLCGSENLPVSWGRMGQRTETCVNWGGPIAMVPCLYQRNIYIQRKLRVWRELKCIPLVGGETPLICADRQTTPSHGGWHRAENINLVQYRAENGNVRNFWSTNPHGTAFAPKQWLY